ncbi:MAG: protein kinase domain-containing protein [Planctomycetota bacterium]
MVPQESGAEENDPGVFPSGGWVENSPTGQEGSAPALPDLGDLSPVGPAAATGDSDPGLPAIEVADVRPDGESEDSDPGEPAVAVAEPTVPRNDDPFLGRSFGGYELVEKIGHGGMGMVYRGRQVSLNRSVAVKLLNKALVDNEEFIKRFKREAQAMATIHHPNIVSVIDFGEADGIWFMVAEYVEGTNLARMIREKVMVPSDELVPLIIQCLSGLAYVSRNNIVHRDIKPDNILIDREGTAKIADFGLAKDISNNDTDLTAAGSAMGTPAYMSPEQCMGRSLDVRSDIYSLGVAAYFALTGEKPFTGNSSFEIMTKQREHMPPPPSQLNPQIPEPVSDMVMQMLAKSPGDRFSDADACRDALIGMATEIGLMGPVTRSGEFMFPAPNLNMGAGAGARPRTAESEARMASVAYPAEQQPPPLSLEPLPGQSDASASAPQHAASEAYARSPSAAAPPLPGDVPAMEPAPAMTQPRGTERVPTPSPERAGSSRRGRVETSGEYMTCPRCGHLNQGSRYRCERCDHVFVEEPVQQDPRALLAEADRKMRQENYEAAARLYGRLAEQESDRRQRSVLRAKEREARGRVEEQQVGEAEQRCERFIEQGNMGQAIRVLDRALKESTSVMVSNRLQSRIDELERQRRRRKRRLLMLIVLVVLVAAMIAAWILFGERIKRELADRGILTIASVAERFDG